LRPWGYPLQGLKDIEGIFKRLDVEGSILEVPEFLDLYRQIDLCKGLRRFFQKLKVTAAPHLQEKISKLSTLKTLGKEILQAINTKGRFSIEPAPPQGNPPTVKRNQGKSKGGS